MAKLHWDYFTGEEQYSEGSAVEKDILNYVKTYPADEYSKIFENDSRWTVFYHLTDIRRALLAWYPFSETSNVLEVGAGMGALTGILCEKCNHVTAVELTQIRAETIYNRYKNKDNLDIYVGNIMNMKFKHKFDYITLIGVLEYQGNYSSAVNPYVEFLKELKKFLNPDGKILIAIENRFGIKYWCGVPEDHTGVIYDGINNYQRGGKARTFSKRELETILKEASLEHNKFFYPMPDYKLPQVIMDDKYISEQHMPSRVIPYYLYYPSLLASEKSLYDELMKNKVFGFFANSFFVECSMKESNLTDINYTTITADRNRTHQMCTVIRENKYVEKVPLFEEGNDLIRDSYKNILSFNKKGLPTLEHELRQRGNTLYLNIEYAKGIGLDELLLEKAMERDTKGFLSLLDQYYDDILKSSVRALPEENICLSFEEDGKADIDEYGPILKEGYIDMLPHNCFVIDNILTYYDQEFSVCNLPANFMVFRALKNFYSFNKDAEYMIPLKKVKDHFSLTKVWNVYEKYDLTLLHELTPYGVSKILGGFWYVDTEVFRKNAENLLHFHEFKLQSDKRFDEMENTISKLLADINDTKQENVHLIDEKNSLVERYEKSVNDRKNIEDKLIDYQNNLEELQLLKTQIYRANNEIQTLKETIKENTLRLKGAEWNTRSILEGKNKELKVLHSRCKELLGKLEKTEEEGEVYKKAYECVLNSTSWRVTYPLRRMKDVFQGNQETRERSLVPQIDSIFDESLEKLDEITDNVDKEIHFTPESSIANRRTKDQMINELLKYDVISFDVFDTLLFRYLDQPTDIFMVVGSKLGILNFKQMRIQAEEEARKITKKRNQEINIYDIYQILGKYINIDIETAINIEIETEKEFLFANPYMKEIFDILISHKKIVIFVSDMYLPQNIVNELLKSCGYSGFDKGFVSCDYECGKGNGELQRVASKYYRGKKIIHIGDNEKSDVIGTQRIGWSALWYKKCSTFNSQFRPHEKGSLTLAIYNGIVSTHLFCGNKIYTSSYEYGFLYGGLLVCGFCEWLNSFAQNNSINHILFLARDCDIISKVYNKYYQKYKNSYVRISRLAMWQIMFDDKTEEFVQYFFKMRADKGDEQIGLALRETDLSILLEYLPMYGITEADILTGETYAIVRKMIYEKKKIISEYFVRAKSAAKKYFESLIKEDNNVCAVDLGWSGQILIFLRQFVNTYINSCCNVIGAYIAAATNEQANFYTASGVLNPYLFSYSLNRDMRLKTDTLDGSMIAIFLEAMFSSVDPTLLKYDLNDEGEVKFIWGHCTGSKQNIIEMHQGIMDFAGIYHRATEKNKPIFKISGSEAFAPFWKIAHDFEYNYEIFKDFKELSTSLPKIASQNECTTLGNILKSRNLL